MNKGLYVCLVIAAIGISIILAVFESASYVFYDAQNIYRVYLNGESIGIIEDKKELETYINEQQQQLKNKYNVDNVYLPNGLKIEYETTYNEETNSISDIYNKISASEDFTINGYIVTITDKKEIKSAKEENKIETKKIKEYIYILDKGILQGAVDDVVRSFVNEDEYNEYLNETKKDMTSIGTTIENVYIKEQIAVKKSKIPANQPIFQTEQDLARYLLFGTENKNKTYKVKSGDNVKDIAYKNKMSTEEFLIANKDINNKNALLYEGQEVVISYINPKITVVEEENTVKKESIRFKTIEIEDSNMMPGHYEVIQNGKKGTSIITRKIKKQNGKIINALIVSSEVIKEPIDRKIRTGGDVDWVWPTVGNYTITEHFGYVLRSDIGESSTRLHDGIDIAGLGCGTPIYAAGNGVVEIGGWYPGYGLIAEINHGNGYNTLYGHMNSVAVSAGQTVKKGQQIGTMGNTGYSYGCHLHYKVTYGGSSIDPLSLY